MFTLLVCKRGDMAVRDMIGGHGGDGLIVQLDDLNGLYQSL